MINRKFRGYLRIRDLVDAHLECVRRKKDRLEVVLSGHASRRLLVQFGGVRSVKANHPEGMAVYSVGEFQATQSLRRFVFVNWGGDDSALEVVAESLRVTAIASKTPLPVAAESA